MHEDEVAPLPELLRRAAPFMRATGNAGVVGQHANTCEEAAALLEAFAKAIVEGDEAFTGEAWEATLREAEKINPIK